ncbi:hypothetical protein SynBIOSE41_02059 [Synechococcus sp. BIOS-E4-1]|nr:hypothetical protein SynBIOSE41_02059 [Synechococcus sp. BIOS-E4-1]
MTGKKKRWTPINTPKFYKAVALNRARYWRLICWLFGVIEEMKNPCRCSGFDE